MGFIIVYLLAEISKTGSERLVDEDVDGQPPSRGTDQVEPALRQIPHNTPHRFAVQFQNVADVAVGDAFTAVKDGSAVLSKILPYQLHRLERETSLWQGTPRQLPPLHGQ
jgi:hypothetical protein